MSIWDKLAWTVGPHNVWLWVHMLAGACAAQLGNFLTRPNVRIHLPLWLYRIIHYRHEKLLVCWVAAIGWEVYEYSTGGTRAYPVAEQFFWDAAGDIGFAMLLAHWGMKKRLE